MAVELKRRKRAGPRVWVNGHGPFPTIYDVNGVWRFKPNHIVVDLLDLGTGEGPPWWRGSLDLRKRTYQSSRFHG